MADITALCAENYKKTADLKIPEKNLQTKKQASFVKMNNFNYHAYYIKPPFSACYIANNLSLKVFSCYELMTNMQRTRHFSLFIIFLSKGT